MANCTKVSYPNKKRAKQAAYAIKCKANIGANEALFPYYCNSCGAYHLSKITPLEFLNKVAKYNKQK